MIQIKYFLAFFLFFLIWGGDISFVAVRHQLGIQIESSVI